MENAPTSCLSESRGELSKVPTSQIIELYRKQKLSSTEIGDRVGLTRQAVWARLKNAGVPIRPNAKKPPIYGKDLLERLYVFEGLTVAQVAERLNTTSSVIIREMDVFGIERRKPDAWMVKFPELRKLKVGESIDLPKLTTRLRPHTQFYQMATTIGIRVSTRSIDEKTFRVTRIA